MKLTCPYCKEEIELTQSERAKIGYKKFEDHKAECFTRSNPKFMSHFNQISTPQPDDDFTSEGENITTVIRRLHTQLGRTPIESELIQEMIRLRSTKKNEEATQS